MAVEDDASIGSFKSTNNRVSFKSVPDVCTFVKEHNSVSISEANNSISVHASPSRDTIMRTTTQNDTASETANASIQGHLVQQKNACNDTTNTLESTKGSQSPLASG